VRGRGSYDELLGDDLSLKDISGMRFGRLVVQSRAGSAKTHNGTVALWLCLCDCGTSKVIRGISLRQGSTTSCGCYNRELTTKRLVARNTTHHLSTSPEYHAYYHARRRCTSPKDIGWKDYGGRGIQFLIPSFEEFYAKLGPRPSRKHSLDRIDNEKHYTLDNIRWATKEEQMKNRRIYATIKRIQCANCGGREFVRAEAV